MKVLEQSKWLLAQLATAVILGLHLLLFWLVWTENYQYAMMVPLYRRGNWVILLIYGFLSFIFSRLYGAYKVGNLKSAEIIYSHALVAVFVNGVTYLQISLMARAMLALLPILWLIVKQVLVSVVWTACFRALFLRLYPPQRMLFLYGGDGADELIRKMSMRPDRYNICESMNIAQGLNAALGKLKDVDSLVLCDVSSADRKVIIKYCFEHSVRVYFTPKISDIIVRSADPVDMFDTPLLICRNMGLAPGQLLLKRALDIALSVIMLALASPFMLLTAAAIKLEDGGPVFFSQKRLTLNGRIFRMHKFRSMVADAEKDGVARLASRHDPRVTRVGRVIRRLRIDELPQLLNILKGEMSVVGPRPERPELTEKLTGSMPEFTFRLKVKAGLTGYAQVLGKYNTTPYDKLKLDLTYIENYSLLLDLRLILMTPKILLIPDSAQGVEERGPTAEVLAGEDKQ